MPRGYPNNRKRDWASRTGHNGEKNSNARWTNTEALNIRLMRSRGWALPDLMLMYGGSESAMLALLFGKTYPDAGGPIAGIDYPKKQYYRAIFKVDKAPVP